MAGDPDVDINLGWMALSLGGGPLVPFVPTRKEALEVVFQALDLKPGDIFYDLGCGDGRVAIEAAKRFPVKKVVCVETRGDLIEEGRKRAVEEGVQDKVVFIKDDFFNVAISEATAVYMYLLTSVNEALKPKLSKELRPGSRVVTLDFQIPGWRPVRVFKRGSGWQNTVYLYIIGESDE